MVKMIIFSPFRSAQFSRWANVGRSFSSSGVLVERTGSVVQITLNRPEKHNALSASTVDDILTAVREAEESGTRLMVFRGKGSSFCAGFDFTGIESQSDGDLLLRFVRVEQMLQSVHRAPFSTVALVQVNSLFFNHIFPLII